MYITTLAGIEILTGIGCSHVFRREGSRYDSADIASVGLLEVDVHQRLTGVGYKDLAQASVDVLQVGANTEVAILRGEPPGDGAGYEEAGEEALTDAAKEADLFADVSQSEDKVRERLCLIVPLEVVECFLVDCSASIRLSLFRFLIGGRPRRS